MLRAPAMLALLALLAAAQTTMGQAPADPAPEQFRGIVSCRAIAPAADADGCALNRTEDSRTFSFRTDDRHAALRLSLDWTPGDDGAPQLRVRLRSTHGIDTSWNGTSPLHRDVTLPRASSGEQTWYVDVFPHDLREGQVDVRQPFGVNLSRTTDTATTGSPTNAKPGFATRLVQTPGVPQTTDLLPWASIALLIPAFLYGVRHALVVGLLRLFSRVDRGRALEHPRREALYEAARARPGVGLEELRSTLGWSKGVFRFHLRVLEDHGLLRVHRQDRRAWIVAAQTPASWTPPPTTSAERIVAHLRIHPGERAADVARCLGIAPTTIWQQTKALARSGRIRTERTPRGVRCYAQPRD